MPFAAPAFVGIDVAKAELVIAIRPSGDRWTVANDEVGIRALLKYLHQHATALVVLEATGGYERAVVAALAAARLPVVVANPPPVRDLAPATRPAPRGSSRRPIRSTPRLWRCSPSACALNRGRCPTKRRPRRTPC